MTAENPKNAQGRKKPPVHLVPPVAILSEAMVFALGAEKYGPYNWRDAGVPASVYFSAAMRHLQSWWDGEDLDPESGQPHLSHARACLAIVLDAKGLGKLLDDRPPAGSAAEFIAAILRDYEDAEIPRQLTGTAI